MAHSLQQYINLYRENRNLLSDISPEWLMRFRDKALELLTKTELPDKKQEGYQKTSLVDLFSPELGVNLLGKDLIGMNNVNVCGIDSMTGIKIFVHNDIISRIDIPDGRMALPKGLRISTISSVQNEDKEILKDFYEETLNRNDAAILLNAMLGIDAILIYIEDENRIDLPIQIVNYAGGHIPMLCNRKVYIKIGKRSSANILVCDHSLNSSSDSIFINNNYTHIDMGEDSNLSYIEMEETNPANGRYSNLSIKQKKGSASKIGSVTLMNGKTRNNFVVYAENDHTSTYIDGLVIGKNESHIDNMTHVMHKGSHGKSNQLFKYAMFDNSLGAFEGRITVEKDARFNEAYQGNKNIVSGSKAHMYSMPQLLIYNDDVKCSHGATTGQLDPNAIYYMQSRGIPLIEAKGLLMQAFMNDVVERYDYPGLKDRLHRLVERRLNGEDILCGTCKFKEQNA